jgi:hypothetical protein
MSKPSENLKGPRDFGPNELFDYVRLQLGLVNRPKAKLWCYKIKGDGLILSRVEMDEILTLQRGEAS